MRHRHGRSESTTSAVAGLYEDFLDGWLVDPADATTRARARVGRAVRAARANPHWRAAKRGATAKVVALLTELGISWKENS